MFMLINLMNGVSLYANQFDEEGKISKDGVSVSDGGQSYEEDVIDLSPCHFELMNYIRMS